MRSKKWIAFATTLAANLPPPLNGNKKQTWRQFDSRSVGMSCSDKDSQLLMWVGRGNSQVLNVEQQAKWISGRVPRCTTTRTMDYLNKSWQPSIFPNKQNNPVQTNNSNNPNHRHSGSCSQILKSILSNPTCASFTAKSGVSGDNEQTIHIHHYWPNQETWPAWGAQGNTPSILSRR